MPVLEPGELEASPLADLHSIAAELEIEGYRRMSREDVVAAILSVQGNAPEEKAGDASDEPEDEPAEERAGKRRERRPKEREEEPEEPEETRSGTLDILPNGSGFMRSDAFAHGADDVYVSAAQIRRCELRSGDELSGPVRPPRRSERYPSLVRVEQVNGADAEPPAERPRFAELEPAFPTERLEAPDAFASAPIGKGSRVVIAGEPGSGATTLLRELAVALAAKHPDLSLTIVLAGVRPEEVPEWRNAVEAPIAGGSFDRPADEQAQAASLAVERAKRVAERGGDAAVLVDALDQLPASAARRVLAGARNAADGGSVTVVAVSADPELRRIATTRVVLEAGGAGEPPTVGPGSGTTRAESLG